ncbi:MAG: CDP-alcohol phosphatidyltransferase family protein [Pseudomonadota bacterium]
MIEPDAHRLTRPPRPETAFAAGAAILTAILVLAALSLASDAGWIALLPSAAFAGAMAVAANRMRSGYPHRALGACNGVTQLRAAMVAMLVLPVLVPGAMAPGAVFALALVALSLDGVDGWLARRARLSSAFGARFDMEVDSALAAVLAALLLLQSDGPLMVAALLVLGFMRYAFVAAAALLPWLTAPLPDRYSRKAVCVAQIGALIATLAMPDLTPALPLVALAVLWSFWWDVAWLARRST